MWGKRLAVAPVAYAACSYAGAWFVFHPMTLPVRLPKALRKTPPRDVRFRSADGPLLSGWWFAAPGATATIILCHGAFEHRVALSDCVLPLLGEGYNVLAFDFRARGKSGGDKSTLGDRETGDLLAAVEWVREQPGSGSLPLGAMGFSQGAAAAIMAAAKSPDLAAIVADSPYASLDSSVDAHLRAIFGPFGSTLGHPFRAFAQRLAGFDPAKVRPVDAIAAVAPRPILLIHGEKDFMTPPDNSQRLLEAAGEGASLWLVPGVRHTKARKKRPEEFWRRVNAFWRESLAPSAAGAGGGTTSSSAPSPQS